MRVFAVGRKLLHVFHKGLGHLSDTLDEKASLCIYKQQHIKLMRKES